MKAETEPRDSDHRQVGYRTGPVRRCFPAFRIDTADTRDAFTYEAPCGLPVYKSVSCSLFLRLDCFSRDLLISSKATKTFPTISYPYSRIFRLSMSTTPEDSLPPGYAEEYIGYITRNVSLALCVMEVVFVGLRYLAQQLSKKKFGIDDWLMIPSLVFCLGLNTSALSKSSEYGRPLSTYTDGTVGLDLGHIGYHLEVVAETAPYALKPYAQILVVAVILYSLACAFPKLVILTLYLRIFNEKKYRIACYTVMGLVITFALAGIIGGATQCIPLSYLWDKTIQGHCFDIVQFYRWGTLPNIVVDVIMIILPLPVIWKLHASRQVKFGLTVTFLTGSVYVQTTTALKLSSGIAKLTYHSGTVTSILRCVAFFENDPLADGTWISVTFFNWTLIEPGVYLIAACLPCYRPLVNYALTGDARGSSARRSVNRYASSSNVKSTSLRTKRTNVSHEVLDSRNDTVGMDMDVLAKHATANAPRESDEQRLVKPGRS